MTKTIAIMPSDLLKKFAPAKNANSRTVDPKAIAEVAIFLINLFSKENEGKNWLPAIRQQLEKMNKLLNTIIDILDQLSVHIDEKFRIDAEVSLMARCNSIIEVLEDFFESSETQRPRIERLHDELRNSRNKYILYGYAFPNSIAFAMRVEKDLMDILKLSSSSKKAIYNIYVDYFDSCISDISSDALKGNIFDRLEKVRETKTNFETSHPSENGVERPILIVSFSERAGGNEGHPSTSTFNFTVFATIKFDLKTETIEATHRFGQISEGREGTLCNGGIRSAERFALNFFNDLIKTYEDSIQTYIDICNKADQLQQAFNACLDYKNKAITLRDNS